MKVVIFNVPTSGHVNPTLPLAAELIQRGHQVIYYLNAAYRAAITVTGAEYRPLPGFPDAILGPPGGQFNPPLLARLLLEMADKLMPSLMPALETASPDVVIYDSMCPWGRLAANMARIPTIASMSLLTLTPQWLLQSRIWREMLTTFLKGVPEMFRYRQQMQEFRRHHGVSPAPFPDILNWPGKLNLCYTSAAIQPNAGALGPHYRFVGPMLGPRPQDGAFPFDRLDPSRPLIYVSLGSVFSANAAFFSTVLQALANEPCQIVLSTGRQVASARLGAIPANAIVRPWVPQLETLQRADLFITHAGMNSVHEGLYYGVPLLLVPQQMEQALVAARIAQLGAGIVARSPVTAPEIRWHTQELLQNPTYRNKAQQLGDTLRVAGGVPAAVQAIEQFFTN